MPVDTKSKNASRIILIIFTCLLFIVVAVLLATVIIKTYKVTAVTPPAELKHSGAVGLRNPELTDSPSVTFYGSELEVNTELNENPFALKDFISHDSGFITYNGEGAEYGIDVSSFQGNIDWVAVKNSGIDFAIIRLGFRGMSEGTLYTDKQYLNNIEGATAAGVDVGIYFFSQATSVEEAQEEAEYVLSVLDGRELQYPIFFDWEPGVDAEDRTNPICSSPIISDFAVSFCNTVTESGYKSGIYFNNYQGYLQYDFTLFEGRTLWLAEYGTPYPHFYYDFDMWQYSCTGTVDGINADVDINIYFK